MKRIRLYLSHPIRGSKWSDSMSEKRKLEVMHENCAAAMEFAEHLRALVPDVDLYVPAEHDEFVQIAYQRGYISEAHILAVDCEIIDSCDGVVYFDPEFNFSSGMKVEHDYAVIWRKPMITFHYPQQLYVEGLYEDWIKEHFGLEVK